MSDRFLGIGLIVSFLAMVSIIVEMGRLGVHEMDSLHADAHAIAQQQWRDVQLASEALGFSNRNSQINTQLVLSDDESEIDSLLMRRTENAGQISKLLARLQTRVRSEQEQKCLDAIVDARKSYRESYHHALSLLLDQKKKKEARELLRHQTFPLLLKYHSAFSDFVQFQTDEMNEELARSAVRYSVARKRAISAMILSILLAVVIAGAVTGKIIREIARREKAEYTTRRALETRHEELEQLVAQRTAELETARTQAELLATTDPLTGIYNRRGLLACAERDVKLSLRACQPLSVAMFDVDHFKRINDSYGHTEGDRVLREIAAAAGSMIRATDLLGRVGGEEFLIVLPNTPVEGAVLLAERIRVKLAACAVVGTPPKGVTASFGIVSLGDRCKSLDALQSFADKALYRAKSKGRNRVETIQADLEYEERSVESTLPD
jgi:two-component system, cell cycle response regulator